MTEDAPLPSPNRLLSLTLILIAAAGTFAAWFYHTDPGQFVILGPDTFLFLEGVARTMQGDLPNHDFASPLGPALWVIPNIFLSESQLWLTIPVMLITATGLALLLAGALLRPENIAQFAALLLLMAYCAMAINAPSRFGDGPDVLLWQRMYSNIANTILVLMTAWITLRLMSLAVPLTWFGASLLGMALFLLFAMKITYFVGAFVLLVAAARTLGQDLGRIMAAFLTPLLFMTVLFPAMTIGYIGDVVFSMTISQADPMDLLAEAQLLAPQYALQFAAVAALLFLAYRADASQTRALLVFLVTCLLITLFIDFFDGGPTKSAPLLGVITGLAVALIARPKWPLAALPLLLLVMAFAPDAYTKAKALEQNHKLAHTIDTVTYNRFRIDMTPGLPVYIRTAEAAFSELDQKAPTECLARGYAVADISNPFHALLARPGAAKAHLWIDAGVTVDRSNASDFLAFMGGAAFVMVPKSPLSAQATAFVTQAFATDLAELEMLYENDGWRVYGAPECF